MSKEVNLSKQNEDQKSIVTNSDRRKAVQNIIAGSALGTAAATHKSWVNPVISSVILPAHAQTSAMPPQPGDSGGMESAEITSLEVCSSPNGLFVTGAVADNAQGVGIIATVTVRRTGTASINDSRPQSLDLGNGIVLPAQSAGGLELAPETFINATTLSATTDSNGEFSTNILNFLTLAAASVTVGTTEFSSMTLGQSVALFVLRAESVPTGLANPSTVSALLRYSGSYEVDVAISLASDPSAVIQQISSGADNSMSDGGLTIGSQVAACSVPFE